MNLPLIRTPVLYHVGTLNPAHRVRSESLEADFLSASLCPESWEMVARLGGCPTLTLEAPGAAFIDACSVSDADFDRIISDFVRQGLMEPVEWFKAWHWDDEADDWAYMACETREVAEEETEGYEPDDGPDGEVVQICSGFRLTEAGAVHLPRLPRSPIFAEDAALMLFAKTRGEAEGIWGVFWDEDDRPELLTAPRYAITPAVLPRFRVSGPLGDLPFSAYVAATQEEYIRVDF